MQASKKFAFDVGISFLASTVTLPLGFVITIALGKYPGAGDLGLYRMTSTIYGIAMLVAALGNPAAMIKYVAEFTHIITPKIFNNSLNHFLLLIQLSSIKTKYMFYILYILLRKTS
jgi:O-antigen/teichoic acid export membrane protein